MRTTVTGRKRGHAQILAHCIGVKVQTVDNFCLRFPFRSQFMDVLAGIPSHPRPGLEEEEDDRCLPDEVVPGELKHRQAWPVAPRQPRGSRPRRLFPRAFGEKSLDEFFKQALWQERSCWFHGS